MRDQIWSLLDDLNNFKLDATVRQWEGEIWGKSFLLMYFPKRGHLTAPFPQAKKSLEFNLLSHLKRERKTNYSVDSYFRDTLRAGQAKIDMAPKIGPPNRSQCE
jgi:SWI/SNF-related matrix-associated actin-dependent regulator of chromatin subfamily A member 5